MHRLLGITVLLLVLPELAQQNDAEKLYRAMEKQVRDAKTLKLAFEIDADVGKESGKARGVVYIAAGNKARVEAGGKMGGQEVVMTMIADGKESFSKATGMPKEQRQPVEPTLSLSLPQFIARGGVWPSLTQIGPPKEGFDIEKVLIVSEFRLGKKEMVGQREAQSVICSLKPTVADAKTMQMTVWLDTKSNLPLKRMLSGPGPDGKEVFTLIEFYTEIALNPTIDSKLFELPK